MELSATIEALLFFSGEPLAIRDIVRRTHTDRPTVESAIEKLGKELERRGIRLSTHDDSVSLVTAPEASALIEEGMSEELSRDLGRAALEVLAIVLYLGPITRSEIDYIRAVNSTFTLRALLVRGLIEKVPNQSDKRAYLYQPSFAAQNHLGIGKLDELPEYVSVRARIEEFRSSNKKTEKEHGA